MSIEPEQQHKTHEQSQAPRDGQPRVKPALRILGPILLVCGILMTLIGFGNFIFSFIDAVSGDPFSGESNAPILFIALGIPGIILMGIGGPLTQAGYLKEITTYGAKETTPAVTIATTAVRAAILDDDIPCPTCATPIEPDSKFCSSCGQPVNALQCPSCEHPIEANDRFCNSCGTNINEHQSA